MTKQEIEYEDAPSGAIRLYNYKEPFMDTPNGFGYLGVLMHDAKHDLIQCHVCGEWFNKLANHIQTHNIKTVSEYKKEFGLSQSTALVADGLRELMIQNGRVNGRKTGASLKKAQLTAMKIKQARKKNGTLEMYKMSMEVRNNRGTCPLQLLDKLDRIKKEIGHTPTHHEVWTLKSLDGKYFSGRGLLRSIEYTHGSWENAVKQLHWTDVDRQKNRKWTKKALEEELRAFVKKNKRFPYPSDCRRNTFPYPVSFKPYGGIRKMKDQLLAELTKFIK